MFGLGMTELLVILAIVLLIFGPKRLKNIGADLGNAIKGFRTAVSEDEEPPKENAASQEKVIEGESARTDSQSGAGSEVRQDNKV